MAFFQLVTPAHLFEKMERDLEALNASSSDSMLAFNFFVTAENLPDWLGQRSLVREQPMLGLCRISQMAQSTSLLIRSGIRQLTQQNGKPTLRTT